MVQSAFRNLLNCQAEFKGKLVNRAYMTYEEVFQQIKQDLCQEEVDILLGYIFSTKFLTFDEQVKKAERLKALREKRLREKSAKDHDKLYPSAEEIAKANKINPADYQHGPPRLWNGKTIDEVKQVSVKP